VCVGVCVCVCELKNLKTRNENIECNDIALFSKYVKTSNVLKTAKSCYLD
jgi:hypothetical protein